MEATWISGICRSYIAQSRNKDRDNKDEFSAREITIPESCVEIVDPVPAIDAGFPEEEKPRFFGKICRDKITGYEGICIGRYWNFYAEKQYCIQAKYSKKKLRKPSPMWLDEGRIEVLTSQKGIEPEEVQSERRGGCIDIPLPGRYLSKADMIDY